MRRTHIRPAAMSPCDKQTTSERRQDHVAVLTTHGFRRADRYSDYDVIVAMVARLAVIGVLQIVDRVFLRYRVTRATDIERLILREELDVLRRQMGRLKSQSGFQRPILAEPVEPYYRTCSEPVYGTCRTVLTTVNAEIEAMNASSAPRSMPSPLSADCTRSLGSAASRLTSGGAPHFRLQPQQAALYSST